MPPLALVILLFSSFALLLSATLLASSIPASFADPDHILKNTVYVNVTCTETFVNNGKTTVPKLDIYMLPPMNTSRQRALDFVSMRNPDSIVRDEWGQRIFKHTFEGVKPGESVQVSWAALVEISEISFDVTPESVGPLTNIPADIRMLYLKDDPMFGLSDPIVKAAVNEAVGNETNVYRMVLRIHDYIIAHLTYSRDNSWDPAPVVLKRGTGSCTEYTMVFIAMCRAKGIPARFSGGSFVSDPSKSLRDDSGHRWQEVYLPNWGWVPVDVTLDDSRTPARTHLYFLRLSNTHLAMATAGGKSEYMGWRYDGAVAYPSSTKNVSTQYSCLWEPAKTPTTQTGETSVTTFNPTTVAYTPTTSTLTPLQTNALEATTKGTSAQLDTGAFTTEILAAVGLALTALVVGVSYLHRHQK